MPCSVRAPRSSDSGREQGDLYSDVRLKPLRAIELANVRPESLADFVESAGNSRMVDEAVEHPGGLRSLSWEDECEAHGQVSPIEIALQGSLPSVAPPG